MRRVLLVAYHFPPLRGSSGIQRTLRFVQYLPRFGWETAVLTVHPWAYETTGPDLMDEVPVEVPVVRAFGFDTARHLSVRGWYPYWAANPDRWVTWKRFAVRAGIALIDRWRPEALWSTFPIATAHSIALELHRQTSVPWIADFRDPMAQPDYPAHHRVRKTLAKLEAATVRAASVSTFVTETALTECRARYPDLGTEHFAVIENGFDESSFTGLAPSRAFRPDIFILLHSGLIDADDRDPLVLLQALAQLRRDGTVRPANFRLVFRAPGNERWLTESAKATGVADLIAIRPPVGYREALAEMLGADALLIVQGASCASQVPAKLYEYARSGRPILGLVEPRSASDLALQRLGVKGRLDSRDPTRLADQLRAAVAARMAAADWRADSRLLGRWSREALADRLARLLSRISER